MTVESTVLCKTLEEESNNRSCHLATHSSSMKTPPEQLIRLQEESSPENSKVNQTDMDHTPPHGMACPPPSKRKHTQLWFEVTCFQESQSQWGEELETGSCASLPSWGSG